MPVTKRFIFNKRGKLIAIGAVVLAILVVAACLIKQAPESPAVRINGFTVGRIRVGMTRQDVEAIFHVSAGEYSSFVDPEVLEVPTKIATRHPGVKWESWGGNDAVLFVHFGPDGKADDWWGHGRRPKAKRDRFDQWMDTIKYKWLGW